MSWLARIFSPSYNKRRSEASDTDIQPLGKKSRILLNSGFKDSNNPFQTEDWSHFDLRLGGRGILTSALIPRPVVLLITRDSSGKLLLAPTSSCALVSEDPAVISFSLLKTLVPDPTAIKEFTVNMVSEWLAQTAFQSSESAPESLLADLETNALSQVSVPRAKNAALTLECVISQHMDITDRSGTAVSTLFVAEVAGLGANKGILITNAQGNQIADAEKLQPVAALGGNLCGRVVEPYLIPELKHPPSPPTPGGLPETRNEQVGQAVSSALEAVLGSQSEASAVKEVTVTLAPQAEGDPETPISVVVQEEEEEEEGSP